MPTASGKVKLDQSQRALVWQSRSRLPCISDDPIRAGMYTQGPRARHNGPHDLRVWPVLRVDAVSELDESRLGSKLIQRIQNPVAPEAGAQIPRKLKVWIQQGTGRVEVDETDANLIQRWMDSEALDRSHDQLLKRADEVHIPDAGKVLEEWKDRPSLLFTAARLDCQI